MNLCCTSTTVRLLTVCIVVSVPQCLFPRRLRCIRHLTVNSMAINFKDGVILGADSRTTTGAYIANRVTDKLTQVHDTIWCCRSGSAADTQAVADIVHYHLGMYGITNDEAPTTQTAAAIFQELCYANKDSLS